MAAGGAHSLVVTERLEVLAWGSGLERTGREGWGDGGGVVGGGGGWWGVVGGNGGWWGGGEGLSWVGFGCGCFWWLLLVCACLLCCICFEDETVCGVGDYLVSITRLVCLFRAFVFALVGMLLLLGFWLVSAYFRLLPWGLHVPFHGGVHVESFPKRFARNVASSCVGAKQAHP